MSRRTGPAGRRTTPSTLDSVIKATHLQANTTEELNAIQQELVERANIQIHWLSANNAVPPKSIALPDFSLDASGRLTIKPARGAAAPVSTELFGNTVAENTSSLLDRVTLQDTPGIDDVFTQTGYGIIEFLEADAESVAESMVDTNPAATAEDRSAAPSSRRSYIPHGTSLMTFVLIPLDEFLADNKKWGTTRFKPSWFNAAFKTTKSNMTYQPNSEFKIEYSDVKTWFSDDELATQLGEYINYLASLGQVPTFITELPRHIVSELVQTLKAVTYKPQTSSDNLWTHTPIEGHSTHIISLYDGIKPGTNLMVTPSLSTNHLAKNKEFAWFTPTTVTSGSSRTKSFDRTKTYKDFTKSFLHETAVLRLWKKLFRVHKTPQDRGKPPLTNLIATSTLAEYYHNYGNLDDATGEMTAAGRTNEGRRELYFIRLDGIDGVLDAGSELHDNLEGFGSFSIETESQTTGPDGADFRTLASAPELLECMGNLSPTERDAVYADVHRKSMITPSSTHARGPAYPKTPVAQAGSPSSDGSADLSWLPKAPAITAANAPAPSSVSSDGSANLAWLANPSDPTPVNAHPAFSPKAQTTITPLAAPKTIQPTPQTTSSNGSVSLAWLVPQTTDKLVTSPAAASASTPQPSPAPSPDTEHKTTPQQHSVPAVKIITTLTPCSPRLARVISTSSNSAPPETQAFASPMLPSPSPISLDSSLFQSSRVTATPSALDAVLATPQIPSSELLQLSTPQATSHATTASPPPTAAQHQTSAATPMQSTHSPELILAVSRAIQSKLTTPPKPSPSSGAQPTSKHRGMPHKCTVVAYKQSSSTKPQKHSISFIPKSGLSTAPAPVQQTNLPVATSLGTPRPKPAIHRHDKESTLSAWARFALATTILIGVCASLTPVVLQQSFSIALPFTGSLGLFIGGGLIALTSIIFSICRLLGTNTQIPDLPADAKSAMQPLKPTQALPASIQNSKSPTNHQPGAKSNAQAN